MIEHGRRRVHLAGIPAHPTAAWVTQQARNPFIDFGARADRLRILIHDRDSTFTAAFDAAFAGADIRIIRTPIRAPRRTRSRNAFIRTMRPECLDHLLITGHAISTSCCASMCGISTRTGLTDHRISTHPRAVLLAVAMVGVFGTMAADIPHFLGISLWVTSAGYLLAVLAIFAVWYRAEGTLSFAGITRGRREGFYWASVMATFALGTAVGDLTADSWQLGNLVSGFLFCGLIALPVLARRWAGLNYVAAFWTAYVLTRPLGASFADWRGGPAFRGGLDIPTALVAVVWGLAILALGAYLLLTNRKRADGVVRASAQPTLAAPADEAGSGTGGART